MDEFIPIDDMEFRVELYPGRVYVDMYYPDSREHCTQARAESVFTVPSRFAVRSAMRQAYWKYKSEFKRDRRSGAYDYRKGQVG